MRDPDSGTRTAMSTGGNTADNVGSLQVDGFQGHFHSMNFYLLPVVSSGTYGFGGGGQSIATASPTSSPVSDGSNGIPRITSETRPVNAYVNWIVKY
ncbi:MAG: hypothetical protein IPQ05_13880 [Leptospiraceae bacterium]|nr:hypothetical protein [Leptospiraceae bacterium]